MTNDDLLFRHSLQLFPARVRWGSAVPAASSATPVELHRWKPFVERHGLEFLRPRERRPPRIRTRPRPGSRSAPRLRPWPAGLGPRRIAAQLARPEWGGERIGHNACWKILRRHGISTRRGRLSLVAGHAAPPEPERPVPLEPHLQAPRPGSLAQLDCFHSGFL